MNLKANCNAFIAWLLLAMLPLTASAQKLSDLTVETSAASGDKFLFLDVSATAAKTITLSNLTLSIASGLSSTFQPLDSDLTSIAALTTTSFGRGLLTETNAGTLRTTAGLVIGTDVQAYDADLTTYAGITPSANVQSLLGAADYAAFKSSLSLGNVENTALSTWAGTTNITTLGTIATGTWNGSVIGPTYLGTGSSITTKYLRGDGTWQTISAGDLTVGSTVVASGTNGYILYDNSGVLGELATTGSGSVVRATSPTLTTPALGDATGSSLDLSGTVATSQIDLTGTENGFSLFITNYDTSLSANCAVAIIPADASISVKLPASNTTIPIASQQITWSGPTAARTYTLPDTNATLGDLGSTQTYSGAKTFSAAVTVTNTTDSTSGSSGSINTAGGIGVTKSIYCAASISAAGTIDGGGPVKGNYIYVGTNLGSGGEKVTLRTVSDGILTISQYSQNGMTRVNLGGTTSSYPALQMSGTTMTVGLADGTSGGTLAASGSFKVGGGTSITKILSASASIDFDSMNSGDENTKTVTVTGASTTGSPSVGLGWSASLEAGIVVEQAWVSASDTVSIRVRNVSGSTIDPASLTVRATTTAF